MQRRASFDKHCLYNSSSTNWTTCASPLPLIDFWVIMKIRLKAFAVHLGISAIVVALALALIFLVWYPEPFAYVLDVYGVVKTLIAVDLVIGPLLTFILFRPGKKGVKFDLACVALLQIGALLYGLLVCFEQRPVYAVYNEGRFSTVNPDDYIDVENAKTPKNHPYPRYSLTGPVWVGAKAPASTSRFDRLLIQISGAEGGGLRVMPRFYMPYALLGAEAAAAGKPSNAIDFAATTSVAPLLPRHDERGPVTAEQRERVGLWLDGLGLPKEKMVLLPLVGSKAVGLVAVDSESGRVLGTLGVSPWWKF